jgi:hypothetical protein
LSPPDSLDRSADGWSDTAVQSGREYVRRWRISLIPGFVDDVVAIAVRVTPEAGPGNLDVVTVRERWRP